MNPLLVSFDRFLSLKEDSKSWKSWTLTPRQLCDLELLLNGGFSPVTQFLGRLDYESVCQKMRLQNGTLWPIPIVLDLPPIFANSLTLGEKLILQDPEGIFLALLTLNEIWEPDRHQEAHYVYGTTNPEHFGVYTLLEKTHPIYVSGTLEGVSLPRHYDFQVYRQTPAELKKEFQQEGWQQIIAFQTRNPLHRAHVEMTLKAVRDYQAKLLIHPSVGLTQTGDVDYFTRVRCYQAVLPYYPKQSVKLSLLPLAMRMAGPREAVLHAILRKNYGCTHFIIGRDHAGPG
ncbi:MAG: sulfate adenylyltransferase, partial [Planctomycetota bacterium]